MTALGFCLASFLATYLIGRRSLGSGLVILLGWMYFFGILRANLDAIAGHFILDASVLGIYAARLFQRDQFARSKALKTWIILLSIWVCSLGLVPFQPALVVLVGIRYSLFFLPVMLLGTRLTDVDLRTLSRGVAVLNIVTLCIAMAEFRFGIERFYPHNSLTTLIYMMHDAGGDGYRIPGTFSSPAAYGTTMLFSLALLFGRLGMERKNSFWQRIVIAGLAAAYLGVLLCSCRTPFVEFVIVTAYAIFSRGLSPRQRVVCATVVLVCGVIASRSQRLQRFTTLRDTQMVEGRVAGSVNESFIEALLNYPIGNGIGGGGTPMPYFVESSVRNPVVIENEYGRIVLEQGVIGLLVWIAFFFWVATRSTIHARTPWRYGRRIAWVTFLVQMILCCIGVGIFSFPYIYLMIGWFSVPRPMVHCGMVRIRAAVPGSVLVCSKRFAEAK